MLLPPSETKRDGGDERSHLDLATLSFTELTPLRTTALAALRALSRNRQAAARALKLGSTQQFEIDRNRAITISAVMPALERYTGVLYEALDGATLTADAIEFARGRVAIHSALFGLVAAHDLIPAYRLSHDSRLPHLRLGELWRASIAAVLEAQHGFILDLRSESYVNLGPIPERGVFVRVVTEGAAGSVRALNHFNKKGKGEFVRAVLESGVDHDSAESFVDWARGSEIRLEFTAPGELLLYV